MRLIAIFSILVTLTLSALAAQAAGCACSPDPFENRWNKADVIFKGTVVKIKELPEYVRKGNANDMPVSVILRVDEKYKGKAKVGGGFELETSLTRDTCTGHPFEEKQQYLIFAYQRADDTFEPWSLYNMPIGTYDVGGLCGGTKKIDAAAGDDMSAIQKKLAEEPEEKPSKNLLDNMLGK